MIDNQSFNLEKIKEFTNPINDLYGKSHKLEKIYEKFTENYKKFSLDQSENILSSKIRDISKKIDKLYHKAIENSYECLHKFLLLKNSLVKKYHNSFVEKLKNVNIDLSDFTYGIGKSVIEYKKISKIIEKPSFSYAITPNQWLELVSSLKKNSIFLYTINKVKIFLNSQQKELNEITAAIKTNMQEDSEIEQNFKYSDLEYFKYSRQELDRRKRREKRKKLKDLQNKPAKEIEMSPEISEKIQEYKEKLESSFKEKYLIQKDDSTDPLDLIRERKKTKEKEYKSHIRKFKNKE